VVPGSAREAFQYIVDHQSEVYPTLAAGHHRFETVDGLPLHPGSTIDCQESAGSQTVVHRYEVHTFEPGQCLAYSSRPSRVTIHLPRRTWETQSHSHVWYHFEEVSPFQTKIRLSIAVEFQTGFEYHFSRLTGGLKVWEAHGAEEMAGLRTAYLLSRRRAPASVS